ncbi:MAG TPA: sulfatase-like hydrolase/transferase, partial [Solirubrobacteraceae bacterium]|nr:sulfatase-like hydrolase/transferase [Solirubrobacteraceae bacterium]
SVPVAATYAAAVNASPRSAPAARHLVVVTLDSCRFDSWTAAAPPNLTRLGPVERRYSYASWTAPSHYNLLSGLVPHANPRRVYASEHYKRDFARYAERLGIDAVSFRDLLPGIWLPSFLREKLGYRTQAMVSLPVLNPATGINRGFDGFELMPRHNDMAAMLERMRFDDDRPTFHLLNVGETHYPYALPHEPPSEWPKLHGVHGVFKHIGDPLDAGEPAFFEQADLDRLRERQVEAVRYLDGVFARLFDLVPPSTWIVVTADHGELFGEEGFFGHGPVMHEKVFEVPFVEGPVPQVAG